MPYKAIMLCAVVALCVAAAIVAQTEPEESPRSPGEIVAAVTPGPDAQAATTGSRSYRGGRR